MRAETLLGGVRVVASPYMPPAGEDAYPDWRERLARWLAPTTRIPTREPLTKPRPAMFLIGDALYGRPETIAMLTNLGDN